MYFAFFIKSKPAKYTSRFRWDVKHNQPRKNTPSLILDRCFNVRLHLKLGK